MKNHLPIIVATGVCAGILLRGQFRTPEYVTVTFAPDNHFTAPEPSPIPPATRAHAQENVNETAPIVAIEKPNVNKLVDYIWKAESCRGKCGIENSLQKYCEERGGWNELGYGGMAGVNGVKKCFANKAEGWAFVTDWVTRHLEKYEQDEAKTLCRYNLGGNEVNCKYYQKYVGAI